MLKKLDKMKIGQRLKESFKHVIIDFMVLLIILIQRERESQKKIK